MKKQIVQEVTLSAKPQQVYNLLTNSKLHAEFSGAPAKIDAKVGGKFTEYDGSLEGVNLVLEPGKRIVQAWRCKSFSDAADYSVADYRLEDTGDGRTKVSFEQNGVPENCADDIANGWKAYYWEPMEKFLLAN